MICRVYATPQDMTPAYRIGIHAARILVSCGFSVRTIPTPDRIPQVKNWIQGFITAMYIVVVPVLGIFFGKKVSGKVWCGAKGQCMEAVPHLQ